jgi:hypothetical protein
MKIIKQYQFLDAVQHDRTQGAAAQRIAPSELATGETRFAIPPARCGGRFT